MLFVPNGYEFALQPLVHKAIYQPICDVSKSHFDIDTCTILSSNNIKSIQKRSADPPTKPDTMQMIMPYISHHLYPNSSKLNNLPLSSRLAADEGDKKR